MSLIQSLIIYKFPTLFSILNEIKNNLNFDIKNVNNNNSLNIQNGKNVILISGEKKKVFENQIIIDEYPINLKKLIEIINVQFLKNKFNQQNNIKTGKYFINLNSRVMTLNDKSLRLTEKEIRIINFLNISREPVAINKLQSEVWGYKSKLETHTVETHIYRLRKKIEKKFGDNKFISSIKGGYKINA
tara:strand:- start:1261 stop:1824 length:564 start_codon:yes stop_codon:yes gene_type:complete